MTLLTAEQMAKELGMSVKTFYKRVRKYAIPFVDARQAMFDRAEVYQCLKTAISEKAMPETPKAARRRGGESATFGDEERYAKLLGLK